MKIWEMWVLVERLFLGAAEDDLDVVGEEVFGILLEVVGDDLLAAFDELEDTDGGAPEEVGEFGSVEVGAEVALIFGLIDDGDHESGDVHAGLEQFAIFRVVAVALEERDELIVKGVLLFEADNGPEEGFEFLQGVVLAGGRFVEGFEEKLAGFGGELGNDFLFVFKVEVERSLGQLGFFGHGIHTEAKNTLPLHDGLGTVEDVALADELFAFPAGLGGGFALHG